MMNNEEYREKEEDECFLNHADLISLTHMYLDEWKHRDELLWKQIFVFFYAILIVILLPNIASAIKIQIPEIPSIIFPILGIALSGCFAYIALGYAKRLEASSRTYSNLIAMFPQEYQRIKVQALKHGKLYNLRLANFIPWIMFISLFVLSIIQIYAELK